MVEDFGKNAGKVWNILNEDGKTEAREIKTKLKFTDKKLYAALGWLAREGKIVIEESGKNVFVSLV